MLVLKRYRDQSILIGDEIRVTVTGLGGSDDQYVKLGIDAPREIRVDREEIAIAKRQDLIKAARESEAE